MLGLLDAFKMKYYVFVKKLHNAQKEVVFFDLDPDELIPKLSCFKNVVGKDNPQLNEQIVANTAKLLESERLTTNQQHNFVSASDWI